MTSCDVKCVDRDDKLFDLESLRLVFSKAKEQGCRRLVALVAIK